MFVSPADIGDARYVNATAKTLTEAGHRAGRRIPKGSILFVCIGSTIGKVAQAGAECTTNQQINAVVPDRKNDSNFLVCVLDKQAAQIRLLAGKQAVPIINKSTFAAIQITIPTLPEQQKIAAFLTAVDGRIEQLSRKKALLEATKKGVMQQLFTQTLRFQDDHGHDFPYWEEKTLGEVAKLSKGAGISKADIEESGATPCIRYGELYTEYAELISVVKSRTNLPVKDLVLSRKNDVIIPASGETHIDIARAACVMEDGVALGGDLNIMRTKHNGVFLAYYLNNACKHAIASVAQGSSVVHLYPDQLRRLALRLPSLPEQTKIAGFLSALDGKIGAVGEQMRQTQAWKKGLLQQMFV